MPRFFVSFVYISFFVLVLICCGKRNSFIDNGLSSNGVRLVDSLATSETKQLYTNLFKLQGKAILFGQQNALANGVGWNNDGWRCDVYDVCGSYPAVFGWELTDLDTKRSIDSLLYDDLSNWMSSVYDMGGINVVSWHYNPFFIGSTVRSTVGDLFNIGLINNEYKRQLHKLACFLNNLNSKEGTNIPVFLRLFPESRMTTGLSFQSTDSTDFIHLWQYTVSYLKDSCAVHNALYVYSTKQFINKSDFLSFFPGEKAVDVIGLNNYSDFSYDETVSRGVHQLANLTSFAQSIHKLSALSETGQEGLPSNKWWTNYLLYPIKADGKARNISWIMTWKNTTKSSCFTPYPTSTSIHDFIKFESDSLTYFVDDLISIYR